VSPQRPRVRPANRLLIAALIPVVCFALCGPAPAQQDDISHQIEQAEGVAESGLGGKFVIAPIPIINPTLGVGLAAGAAYLYRFDAESQTSFTGAGGLYTDNKSKAFGVGQSANFNGNNWKIKGGAFVFDLNLEFYGIGGEAGDDDRFLPLNQQGWGAGAKVLRRIADNWYGGASYYYIQVDTTFDLSGIDPDFPVRPPPEADDVTSVAAVGLAFEYDSRDSQFGPSHGSLFQTSMSSANEAVGSDFDFSSFKLSYNRYWRLGERSVIAARGAGCAVPGDAPFYALCKLGVFPDLRGYVAGRYRDETMLAIQAEWRWRFLKRFGAVVFAGTGQVAPSLSDYDLDDLLPSAGVGIRYLLSVDHNLNISIDYAVGRGSDAVYFYVGESF
jgi:outer membrane protein assembly factor BamA